MDHGKRQFELLRLKLSTLITVYTTACLKDTARCSQAVRAWKRWKVYIHVPDSRMRQSPGSIEDAGSDVEGAGALELAAANGLLCGMLAAPA